MRVRDAKQTEPTCRCWQLPSRLQEHKRSTHLKACCVIGQKNFADGFHTIEGSFLLAIARPSLLKPTLSRICSEEKVGIVYVFFPRRVQQHGGPTTVHHSPTVRGYTSIDIIRTVYDLPATQSEPLRIHLSLEKTSYAWFVALMYAISAAPNIVLPLCSGAAVQRYGARGVLLITMGLVCGGQAYLAVAVQARSPVNMIVGRLMYGSGTEVLGVLTADLISQCFL
jgi:hypothetical protein